MEIMTREIQRNQMGKSIIDQFVLDEDYNVPDSKRDIERIVVSEGKVRVEEIKNVEGIGDNLYETIKIYITT